MRDWIKRLVFPLSAVLMAGLVCAGCFGDDNGDGGGNGLVGIWQFQEMDGADVEYEFTVNLKTNGTFSWIAADFENEICETEEGTWTATETEIMSTVGGDADTVGYVVDENVLVIGSDGDTEEYQRVTTMPTCDDYGFEGGGPVSPPGDWSGTISASIDGTPTDFSTFVAGVVDQGVGIIGNNGTSQIQINILGDTPGSYTLSTGNQGIYIPDVSNPIDLYLTIVGIAVGTADFTTITDTQIVGTFQFTGTDAMAQNTVNVTNGVINISQ